LFFPRLRASTAAQATPMLSVLIPARNEAETIGPMVQALLAEGLTNAEILILDDNSDDGTAAIALAAAQNSDQVRVLQGSPLPAGWLGKNWACQQLAAAAKGDLLLFTDADVRCRAGALAALCAEQARSQADLLTVWPSQESISWAERLVVPLLAMVIWCYLPIWAVHRLPLAALAAANGQCLCFRRQAYTLIGGHAAVRANIVEDVALARKIKRARLRLRMADAAGLIGCRMYKGWPEVRDGFAKNILAGHGNSALLLAVSTVFHWLVFVGPLLLGWPHLLRVGSALATRQRPADSLLLPLSVLLMTLIAGRALWWRLRYGGVLWKGRLIRTGG
jgi:chlorobactene glucosyltransferase